MPTLNISSIPSQQKTISSSSPQQQGSKFKSDDIIKDSDEGDVLPPSKGNQKPESKRKHKDRSIRTLTAKASAAISTGPPTRKRKRDILSAAVIDDPLSDSNNSGSESGSGNEDSVEGSDNELSKTKEKK